MSKKRVECVWNHRRGEWTKKWGLESVGVRTEVDDVGLVYRDAICDEHALLGWAVGLDGLVLSCKTKAIQHSRSVMGSQRTVGLRAAWVCLLVR